MDGMGARYLARYTGVWKGLRPFYGTAWRGGAVPGDRTDRLHSLPADGFAVCWLGTAEPKPLGFYAHIGGKMMSNDRLKVHHRMSYRPSLCGNALEPVITQHDGFHYGKHHKGYVDNLNKLSRNGICGPVVGEDHHRDRGQAEKAAIFNKRRKSGTTLLLEKHEIERWRRTARRTEAEN